MSKGLDATVDVVGSSHPSIKEDITPSNLSETLGIQLRNIRSQNVEALSSVPRIKALSSSFLKEN